LFDKDQITLIDKYYFGKTEISTVSDFKSIKNDVNICSWYLAGKLGGFLCK
jgi:hypothetical protein